MIFVALDRAAGCLSLGALPFGPKGRRWMNDTYAENWNPGCSASSRQEALS